MKGNIPFDIKVATTVQNLTNEFKGNLEKILAESHLHHNRSQASYLQTHQLCRENKQEGIAQKGRSSQPSALCQPPPPGSMQGQLAATSSPNGEVASKERAAAKKQIAPALVYNTECHSHVP